METRDSVDGFLAMLLQFLHTISDWTGGLIASGIESIFPSLEIPPSLASSIGLLAVLSVLLGIAEIAKKIAWIIVLAGWVLVAVRIGLLVFS